ncbi:hypothetical protein BSLG_010602 [Batrachochytrium salamandrivorans]|nr:hypothetical protein BSLG_010602 [Batrachochytrium salamandrivorans]
MDKIKEKLEKLRIDADSNLARAEKAEAEVKELKNSLLSETEVQNLQNKISLLQMDLDRAEKRADDVWNKVKKAESDMGDSVKEALERKIQMLEKQLDAKEHDRKESTDKARALELHSETHERKAKQLDAERIEFERRLEDMSRNTTRSKPS